MGNELSQLTAFDFIYSVILDGILEESIYDDKVTAFHVWFAAVLWRVMLFFIEKLLKRYDKVRVLPRGEKSILIQDGEFNVKESEVNHLKMEQLRVVSSLREVWDLYWEPGGKVSLKKYAHFDPTTFLCSS